MGVFIKKLPGYDFVNTKKDVMSIQEKNVNTPEKKVRWIQIRVTDSEKEKIEENAEFSNKSMSQYILDLVLTNNINVNTSERDVNTTILKECILEFNKIMAYNSGKLRFPENLDKNKIRKGVLECQKI